MSVNKAIIVGNLGADPEVRYTADGTAVATFRVATTERYKSKDGTWVDRTEWHRVVAWRKLAEITRDYLKKGKLVYVEGSMQSREYEGRDGVKRKTFEIVASTMKMLGGKPAEKAQGPQEHGDEDFPAEEEEDIPL
jgi:single-strand DNA-binding protein